MRSDDNAAPTDATASPSPARSDPRSEGLTGSVSGGPRHAAPDDAGPRPLIDLSRDPTPGVPDHAAPDDPE